MKVPMLLRLAFAVTCLAAVTVGAALIYSPAGWIIGGGCGLFLLNELT